MSFQHHCATCPCRGRRAPELANGDFEQMLALLTHTCLADLVASFDPQLLPHQRHELLQDFNIARAHLAFYFSIKLAAWRLSPLRVCALGHHDIAVARECARRLLEDPDWNHVPQLQRVSRTSLQHFADGGSLTDIGVEDLRDFCISLRIIPTSERRAEGQHARVHGRGLARPHHSAFFQSYNLRGPSMEVTWCHSMAMSDVILSRGFPP